MQKNTTIVTTLALLAALAGPAPAAPPSRVCGDVNNSGSVGTGDALAVLRKALDLPQTLVCPPPASPVVTGETRAYGTGSDGDIQAGVARAFKDNGNGTITDTATGLIWEKKDNSGGIHDKDNTYTWSSGSGDMNGTITSEFLATLNAGAGFAASKDWRVPNRFELETLLNVDVGVPSTLFAFNSSCPDGCTVLTCSCTRGSPYWTSTTYFTNKTGAWGVNFSTSGLTADLKTKAFHVRAVRGGR